MTMINTYLNFNGNCREAMTFYKECLGGELALNPVAGSPVAEHMPPEAQQNILHACLTSGNMVLMASDMMGPEGITKGNTMALMLQCSSEEEINRFFNSLSAGGYVDHPLADSFWGSKFAHFIDKFGMTWMLNYEKTPQA